MQLIDRREAAVLSAPGENPLRQDRPDAGQSIQLRDGGSVEVHQRTTSAPRAGDVRAGRRDVGRRLPHEQLLAVDQLAGQ